LLQAAAKAAKALLHRIKEVSWWHSVLQLLQRYFTASGSTINELVCAGELDRCYIPSMCPNTQLDRLMKLTMGKRQRASNTASECAGMRLTTRSKLFGQEIWIIVELLVEKHNSVAVFSFGSRARGDFKPWSIYDLSIIADN